MYDIVVFILYINQLEFSYIIVKKVSCQFIFYDWLKIQMFNQIYHLQSSPHFFKHILSGQYVHSEVTNVCV